jgi:hypothetical protein
MIKIKFKKSLNELLVKGDKDADAICAYRQHLWVFDEFDIPEDIANEMLSALDFKRKNYKINDFDSLKDILDGEKKYDVLLGRINTKVGGMKELEIVPIHPSYTKDPESSLVVKKVVKALDIKTVSYMSIGDEDFISSAKKITGELPRTVYHGTTTKYLSSILRNGLSPGLSKTNYDKVSHPDAVFFTSRLEEAAGHAEHAVYKNDGEPLILVMRIPDKDKIIPDYDVDTHAEDTSFPNVYKSQDHSGTFKGKSMTHTKEFGLYGYRGRIPASFIDEYMVVPNHADRILEPIKVADFDTITPQQAKRYAYNKENFDMPTWEEIESEDLDENLMLEAPYIVLDGNDEDILNKFYELLEKAMSPEYSEAFEEIKDSNAFDLAVERFKLLKAYNDKKPKNISQFYIDLEDSDGSTVTFLIDDRNQTKIEIVDEKEQSIDTLPEKWYLSHILAHKKDLISKEDLNSESVKESKNFKIKF